MGDQGVMGVSFAGVAAAAFVDAVAFAVEARH
jgi:hypothetical protein